MNINIQISQILRIYSHTISNVKILQYHQELDENVDTDKKIILEDLICLTTIIPKNIPITNSIITYLRRATTLTQLVDNSYETNKIIQQLTKAQSLIKELS